MSKNYDDGSVTWSDFEPEPEMTGDGSGDPDKHFITIWDDGEEVAVIVHRTVGGKYPLDGELANKKRHNAQVIVDALNENRSGHTFAGELWGRNENDSQRQGYKAALDSLPKED